LAKIAGKIPLKDKGENLEFICPILRSGGAYNLLFPVYPDLGLYRILSDSMLFMQNRSEKNIQWKQW